VYRFGPLALFLVLLTASWLQACAGQASGQSALAMSGPQYRLQGSYLSGPDFTSVLKKDAPLSAHAPLEQHFESLALPRSASLAVSDATLLKSVMIFLLSAEQAELSGVHLIVGERSLQLALPNDDRFPPTTSADIYISVESGRVSLSGELSALGTVHGGEGGVAFDDQAGLTAAFSRACSARRCRHAVLAATSRSSWRELRVLLPILRDTLGKEGSLRLLSSGEQPSSSSTTTDPALSPEAVKLRVRDYEEQLKSCHQQGHAGVEARGGTLLVTFVVTPLGLVFDAQVDASRSTIAEPTIVECVADAFTRMTFAKPQTATTLEYLVRF
jgi:hypothetical protein